MSFGGHAPNHVGKAAHKQRKLYLYIYIYIYVPLVSYLSLRGCIKGKPNACAFYWHIYTDMNTKANAGIFVYFLYIRIRLDPPRCVCVCVYSAQTRNKYMLPQNKLLQDAGFFACWMLFSIAHILKTLFSQSKSDVPQKIHICIYIYIYILRTKSCLFFRCSCQSFKEQCLAQALLERSGGQRGAHVTRPGPRTWRSEASPAPRAGSHRSRRAPRASGRPG